MNDFDDLLTPRELAQVFGIRPATIRRWAKQGFLPYIKVGRIIRFRRSDLERLFDSNTKPPEKPANETEFGATLRYEIKKPAG